jgi:hypothetical protein
MFRNNVLIRNVPRVELDQRARAARLRLERVERLLAPRPAVRHHWFRWLMCISADRLYARAREDRTGEPLSYRGLSFSFAW